MRHPRLLLLLGAVFAGSLFARETQPLPPGVPADYVGHLAPEPKGLLLRRGDRYAICGDSITEQKMYSRLIEAYLAAARPDLERHRIRMNVGLDATQISRMQHAHEAELAEVRRRKRIERIALEVPALPDALKGIELLLELVRH